MGFPFSDHVALLEQFLDNRQAFVRRLESQLFGARGRTHAQNGDRESIADIFNACFFESEKGVRPLPSSEKGSDPFFGARLSGQLEAAHLADGFEPARQDGYSRALDPVELVLRACHHWNRTRWPGTNGRLVYAQSLYAVFMLHQLQHLSLRIWDEDGPWSVVSGDWSLVPGQYSKAAERLQHVQRLLDLLNAGGRSAQAMRLVRDARWLIQTAQGPLTRHVKPYFIKAGHISKSLASADRIEIHKAGAVLAGGHLRSQLRQLSRRTGWAFDDPQLVALTRSSNSMDMALLVRDLVPLLDRYSAACAEQDNDGRLALADAILQGLSADPELLLTRLDLLEPSTMIEDVFVSRNDNGVLSYTAMGEAHREYLARYGELVASTAAPLQQDCRAFDPAQAAYSPLGIVYGFCADLFSNTVLNTLRSPAAPDLSLEDMFNSRGRLEDKRTQAQEWISLPKREGEANPFEHSIELAERMHAALAAALETRAARPAEPNASSVRKCHLYVVPRGVALDTVPTGVPPDGAVSAQEHCLSSDVTRARATGATVVSADRLVGDRAEGRLLACAYSEGAWFGVSKVPLTLCTGQGKDALITDVPPEVIDVLRQMCPELLVVIRDDDSGTSREE